VPIAATDTNDILGLPKVLVADDGTDQTRYLFGLVLILQDNGSETRYLLADGLGSVRAEVVSDTVGAVTTYSPYGNLLAQTGAGGTVYGFTGEQYDNATNLLYLRARYFDPYLNQFQSRDPPPDMPDCRLPRMATAMSIITQ
jgi:RHS repeat-associated protein